MAYQNPATGSYTIHVPKSALTGKFRVIESNQATREEPAMAHSAPIELTVTVELNGEDRRQRLNRWGETFAFIPEAIESAKSYDQKRRDIATAVGRSIDHGELEHQLSVLGLSDEVESVRWGDLDGRFDFVEVSGTKDNAVVEFRLVVDL